MKVRINESVLGGPVLPNRERGGYVLIDRVLAKLALPFPKHTLFTSKNILYSDNLLPHKAYTGLSKRDKIRYIL